MNDLRVAVAAGIVNMTIAALGLYWWHREIDPLMLFPLANEVFFAIYSAAAVFYWYGFARVGKKFGNDLLFGVALFQIFSTIIVSVAGVVYEFGLLEGIWDVWDPISYFLNLGSGIALLVAGVAVERLRARFGDIALWYGIMSMVSGALFLASDFGISYITLLSSSLNIALYLFGCVMLWKAAGR